MQFAVGNPNAGEPEVPVYSEPAADVVPGSGVWDSTDRRFHFVTACPDAPRSGWTALRYEDGTIEYYEPYTRLLVANSPCAAEAFNRHKAGERAA